MSTIVKQNNVKLSFISILTTKLFYICDVVWWLISQILWISVDQQWFLQLFYQPFSVSSSFSYQVHIQPLSPSATCAPTPCGQQSYPATEARPSPAPVFLSYQVTPKLSPCLPLGPGDCGVGPFAPSTSPASSHALPVTAAPQLWNVAMETPHHRLLLWSLILMAPADSSYTTSASSTVSTFQWMWLPGVETARRRVA